MPNKTIIGTVKLEYLAGALDQTAFDAGSPVTIHGSELAIIVGNQAQDIYIPENGVLVKERKKRQQADYGLRIKTNRSELQVLMIALFGAAGTGVTDYDAINPMQAASVIATGMCKISVIDDSASAPALYINYQLINPAPDGEITYSVTAPGEITLDLNPIAPFASIFRQQLS